MGPSNIINHETTHSASSYLDEHLAKEGHNKGGVHAAEASNCADGELPDLKHLIVQCDKQSLQIFSLGEVGVKTLIKGGQHAVSDIGICREQGQHLGPLQLFTLSQGTNANFQIIKFWFLLFWVLLFRNHNILLLSTLKNNTIVILSCLTWVSDSNDK